MFLVGGTMENIRRILAGCILAELFMLVWSGNDPASLLTLPLAILIVTVTSALVALAALPLYLAVFFVAKKIQAPIVWVGKKIYSFVAGLVIGVGLLFFMGFFVLGLASLWAESEAMLKTADEDYQNLSPEQRAWIAQESHYSFF